jgi:hypothetical protein
MTTSRSLPLILIALTAAILSTARADVVEPAAAACRAQPGVASPPGSHWYYRISHADNRHCWYLGSIAQRVHSRAPEAATHRASTSRSPESGGAAGAAVPETSAVEAGAVGATAAAPATQQTAPIQAASPPVAEPSGGPAPLQFATRWSDLATSQHSEAMVLTAPISGGNDASESPPATRPSGRTDPLLYSTVEASIGPAFVAAALVIVSLALAGAGRRQLGQLAVWLRLRGALDGTRSMRQTVQDRSLRLPTPTDPARDVKASMRELMDDLRRADAADKSSQPVSRVRRIAATKGLSNSGLSSKGLSSPASVATPTAALPRLGGHNQSIWRAAETSSSGPDLQASEPALSANGT